MTVSSTISTSTTAQLAQNIKPAEPQYPMQINNNSQLTYQVTLSSPDLGSQTKTLSPAQRLKLADFFPQVRSTNSTSAERSYKIIVSYEGAVVREEQMDEEVYVALLGGPLPRVVIYLQGPALERAQKRAIESQHQSFNYAFTQEQETLLRGILDSNPSLPHVDGIHRLFSVCYCYYRTELIEKRKMTFLQMWAALKHIKGVDFRTPVEDRLFDQYLIDSELNILHPVKPPPANN